MLYDLTYIYNMKKHISEKQGADWWLPGVSGSEKGEMFVKRYQLAVL